MTVTEEIRAEVEAFLSRYDMHATVFGKLACKDPHVVRRLRAGYGLTSGRIDKIRAFIRGYEGSVVGNVHPRRRRRRADAVAA